jgi:uncharacterized damage-inducible protein DinB
MTAPNAAQSVQRLALGDFDHEMATTRRVLERVPEEHWDWRPHAKSPTLGGLASHVASVLALQLAAIGADEFDFVKTKFAPRHATNRAELLALFDETVAQVREAMASVTDDATWFKPWALRAGERVIFELPKVAVFRSVGINHVVHHRAQLGVYLRLLDVPVPRMYGPTADEPF